MRTYVLRFEQDGLGEARAVEFDGEDAHQAFAILGKEPQQRRATLWDGEKLLGVLSRTGQDSWMLG